MTEKKEHWENVYDEKQLKEVSWYEEIPETSLDMIAAFSLPKDAAIIDIGGGDSLLVDYLLALGYTNLTVLDISSNAIERAKMRLGDRAQQIKWIVSDVIDFKPTRTYDLWHDRATFHFLTDINDQQIYVNNVSHTLKTGAVIVISTFAENGPERCSGLAVRQHSQKSLDKLFSTCFKKLQCFHIDHLTPFQTTQKFIYCSFRRR
jgi:trans-aconitate methyltransferase